MDLEVPKEPGSGAKSYRSKRPRNAEVSRSLEAQSICASRFTKYCARHEISASRFTPGSPAKAIRAKNSIKIPKRSFRPRNEPKVHSTTMRAQSRRAPTRAHQIQRG